MTTLRVLGASVLLLHVAVILLASAPAYCDDDEGHLLQGINSFRQTKSVPALSKQDKAGCLAEKIADQMEDQPCPHAGGPITAVTTQTQASNYPDQLKKCGIDVNTTGDGVVLPVCVPGRVATLVLTNYTQQGQYARYINDSRYTGVGFGKEDDWTVLVLTTNSPGGSFTSAASLTSVVALGFYLIIGFFSTLNLFLVY